MRRPTRNDAGVALLFALPPGAGVVGFSANFTGGRVTPLGVVAGAATAAVIFAAVLLLAVSGSDPDEDDEGFGLPYTDDER